MQKLIKDINIRTWGIIFVLVLTTSFWGCIEGIEMKEETMEQFVFFSNPYGLENHREAAKWALNKKYGKDRYRKYRIGRDFKYPSLSFDHKFIRIRPRIGPPEFSVLVTSEKVFFLSPEEFNKFLKIHGKEINFERYSVISLFNIYLRLYGLDREEIFTERHLKERWIDIVRERYNVDPERFTHLEIKREDSYILLSCYTLTTVASFPGLLPSPIDVIISHYSVRIGNKGEMYSTLISRTRYERVIPSGPR